MAKRGLKKGSKCVRRHRNGRCAEFSKKGKARKGPGRPKKRKGGGSPKRELSFLEKMERRFRRKKVRMYSAPDYAERMRKEREAEQEAAQIVAMRRSAAEFTPTSLFGARRRRSR